MIETCVLCRRQSETIKRKQWNDRTAKYVEFEEPSMLTSPFGTYCKDCDQDIVRHTIAHIRNSKQLTRSQDDPKYRLRPHKEWKIGTCDEDRFLRWVRDWVTDDAFGGWLALPDSGARYQFPKRQNMTKACLQAPLKVLKALAKKSNIEKQILELLELAAVCN